jgi:hypothetical protein
VPWRLSGIVYCRIEISQLNQAIKRCELKSDWHLIRIATMSERFVQKRLRNC